MSRQRLDTPVSARGQLRAPGAAEAFTILLFLDGPLTSRRRASQVSGRSAGGQGSLPYFAGRLLWCCAHCRLSFLYGQRPIPRTGTPVSACGSRTSNPLGPLSQRKFKRRCAPGCAVPPSTAAAADLVRARQRTSGLRRFSLHHTLPETAIAPGQVVMRRSACGPDERVVPLGPPAQQFEPLGTHADISILNDEASVFVQG